MPVDTAPDAVAESDAAGRQRRQTDTCGEQDKMQPSCLTAAVAAADAAASAIAV